MGEPSANNITIRRLKLEFPAECDPVLIEGHPEMSYVQIGFSLLLPYLEPYLIRSMHAAKPHIRDPKLLAEIDLFNGQEAQHYQQHRRFNDLIRLHGREALTALEDELDADYRRFSERRSLRFNLAYAEGFEAVTSALAHYCLTTEQLDLMPPAIGELFRWHLVEELEHRTVTFDVYQQVFGGYLYRVCIQLFAHWHLNRFVRRVARALHAADGPSARARYGGPIDAFKRLRPWLVLFAKQALPKVLASYMPWYSPHRLAMPENVRALAQQYSELAQLQAAKSD